MTCRRRDLAGCDLQRGDQGGAGVVIGLPSTCRGASAASGRCGLAPGSALLINADRILRRVQIRPPWWPTPLPALGVITRTGPPGRGASSSPTNPDCAYRPRHTPPWAHCISPSHPLDDLRTDQPLFSQQHNPSPLGHPDRHNRTRFSICHYPTRRSKTKVRHTSHH